MPSKRAWRIRNLIPQTTDRLSAQAPAGRRSRAGPRLELAWKLQRHLESLPPVVDQLGAVGALDDLRRPQWDWPALGQRVEAFRRISSSVGRSIPRLRSCPAQRKFPTISVKRSLVRGQIIQSTRGQRRGTRSRAVPGLFRRSAPHRRTSSSPVSAWTDPSSAVTWMSEPIMELLNVSGYALIFSEYHANPTLWSICRALWEHPYLTDTNATTRLWVPHRGLRSPPTPVAQSGHARCSAHSARWSRPDCSENCHASQARRLL